MPDDGKHFVGQVLVVNRVEPEQGSVNHLAIMEGEAHSLVELRSPCGEVHSVRCLPGGLTTGVSLQRHALPCTWRPQGARCLPQQRAAGSHHSSSASQYHYVVRAGEGDAAVQSAMIHVPPARRRITLPVSSAIIVWPSAVRDCVAS